MSSEQPWTIGSLLQWTTEYFKQHGASSPRLDAEVLLADAMHCQRIDLYAAYHQTADDLVRTRFRELVRRRAAGEPVAYLVGHREFYSLSFRVTQDVLIPRPETELLVLKLLDAAQAAAAAERDLEVADVGTGSGVIAGCAAKHLPRCRVTAIDISSAALTVARTNAQTLGVLERIEFVESNLFESVSASKQFDFVVSNPPYVSQSELEALPDEIKRYEPQTALLAGPTGTEVVERLIPQAAQRLRGGGTLLVEISPMIERRVVDLVEAESRFTSIRVSKDLAGLARVVAAQRVKV